MVRFAAGTCLCTPRGIDANLESTRGGCVGEIVRENVEAMQVIYAASMLEETRVFDVADRLVELWASGVLPVGPREGRSALAAYERGRLGRAERLDVYRRCFGVQGGDPA